MQDFFNKYSEKIKLFEWFSDQDSLQDIYLDFEKKIKFCKLGIEFIDWKFDEDSYIWSGKGETKYKNKIYLNEEIKFL